MTLPRKPSLTYKALNNKDKIIDPKKVVSWLFLDMTLLSSVVVVILKSTMKRVAELRPWF